MGPQPSSRGNLESRLSPSSWPLQWGRNLPVAEIIQAKPQEEDVLQWGRNLPVAEIFRD